MSRDSGLQQEDIDLHGFDLTKVPQSYIADPYGFLKALREQSPVYANPDGTYVLTRYRDMEAIYRNHELWKSGKKNAFAEKFGDTPLYEHHTTSVVFIDPPDHTRIRKLFQFAFTNKALKSFEPRITSLVDSYLDEMAERGGMEIVSGFSFKLPIEVVCDMLGVPAEDRLLLRGWANAILTALEPSITEEQLGEGNRAVEEFKTYLRDLLAHRRAHPGTTHDNEVLQVLADAEADGKKLTEIELLHQCIFMLNAGHETSTNMLSHGIHELLTRRDEFRRLKEDPGLVNTAVEEVLRYQAPIQIGNREAAEETMIGEAVIPKGATVHLMINAANRDPEIFADPDRFDIGRKPNRHFSFGLGIHICAGNNLARLEARIAFARFAERFPDAVVTERPKIAGRVRFREIETLNIAV
jgi:cytochrome P450